MYYLSNFSNVEFGRKRGSKDKSPRKKRNIFEEIQYRQDMQIRNMTPEQRKQAIRNATLSSGGLAALYSGGLHTLAHNNKEVGNMMYGSFNGVRKLTVPVAATLTLGSVALNAGLSNYFTRKRQEKALTRKW